MEDKITLILLVSVTYLPEGVPTADLKHYMTGVVDYALNHGLFTGESPAEVDTWHVEVKEVKELSHNE